MLYFQICSHYLNDEAIIYQGRGICGRVILFTPYVIINHIHILSFVYILVLDELNHFIMIYIVYRAPYFM